MSDASDGSKGAHALLAEAKGIQRYIFDSGPLRDLVGASNLVAGLAYSRAKADPQDLIGRVVAAVTQDSTAQFSRRASGSFCLHVEDKQDLNEIRALWRLVGQLRCPGLELSESIPPQPNSTAIDAMMAAYDSGSGIRFNTTAELLPAGNPLTMYVRRTGKPATGGIAYAEQVHFDLLTRSQREHAAALHATDLVANRFLGPNRADDKGRAYRFPRNLDSGKKEPDTLDNPQFPFRSDGDTRVAVIHADLSGLGETFQNATATATGVDHVLVLATAIEGAIDAAAQAATKILLNAAKPATYADASGEIEIARVPARPVVLGGDDITVLVRADLALPFATRLLEEIEHRTQAALEPLNHSFHGKLPEKLSACAGVAVIRRGQPFLMAYELANDLCSFAKRKAKGIAEKPYPSALAFHVAGSSMQEEYEDAVLGAEMTTHLNGHDHRLTANPYGVGSKADRVGRATCYRLLGLAAAINRLPGGRGGLRELRTLAFENSHAFAARWTRWREVAEERDRKGVERVLRSLKDWGVATSGQLPLFDDHLRTPLFDALDLIDLGTDLREPGNGDPSREPAA